MKTRTRLTNRALCWFESQLQKIESAPFLLISPKTQSANGFNLFEYKASESLTVVALYNAAQIKLCVCIGCEFSEIIGLDNN
jgi:hypothetical protein